MKKLLLSLVIILLSINHAIANNVGNQFYIGLGYQLSKPGYGHPDFSSSVQEINRKDSYILGKNFKNMNFFLAYQINQDLAIETGYFLKKITKKIALLLANGKMGMILNRKSYLI